MSDPIRIGVSHVASLKRCVPCPPRRKRQPVEELLDEIENIANAKSDQDLSNLGCLKVIYDKIVKWKLNR